MRYCKATKEDEKEEFVKAHVEEKVKTGPSKSTCAQISQAIQGTDDT